MCEDFFVCLVSNETRDVLYNEVYIVVKDYDDSEDIFLIFKTGFLHYRISHFALYNTCKLHAILIFLLFRQKVYPLHAF